MTLADRRAARARYIEAKTEAELARLSLGLLGTEAARDAALAATRAEEAAWLAYETAILASTDFATLERNM